jgi:hypothetical protein
LTDKILDFHKEWSKLEGKEKYDLEVKVGKLLTYEILENTEDNTGLIETV